MDQARSNEAINLDQIPLVSKAVAKKLGSPLRVLADALTALCQFLRFVWNGPSHPRRHNVAMFAPHWQAAPHRLANRLSGVMKKAALAFLWISFFVLNAAITSKSIFATPCLANADSLDAPRCQTYIPLINCGQNEEIWRGPFASCGLDAAKCLSDLPIGKRQAFRCSANCISSGNTYQSWPVGDKELLREPVVIGGGGESKVYRGDSFICVAAIHAGLVSRYTGGCGELEWIGPHTEFMSTLSFDKKFASTPFNGEFPRNFRFVAAPRKTGCRDLRIGQILVNSWYIVLAAYFLTSPNVFLGTLGVFGFATVMLASHPPWVSGTPELNAEFTSRAFARFLPFLLGLVYVYQFACRPQMANMPACLSRALVYGGCFLLGVLENYTFKFIPVDRLLVADLNAQPGAWLAVGIIAVIGIGVVGCQVYAFWTAGKFRTYFAAYLVGAVVLGLLAQWPNQTLRLHHYAYSLALLPGTALPTTLSLALQGLFTGLYVSGIARWDFDSVLQTQLELSRGNADNSIFDPQDLFVAGSLGAADLAVHWTGTPSLTYGHYSVLINDIERQLVTADFSSSAQWFNLTEYIFAANLSTTAPLYVRVAAAAVPNANFGPNVITNFHKTGRFSSALTIDLPRLH